MNDQKTSNKNEFFNNLYYYLKLNDLSETETEEILNDYEAHFIEGKNNGLSDVEIINNLGDPLTIAKQFVDEKNKTFKTNHSNHYEIKIPKQKINNLANFSIHSIWTLFTFIIVLLSIGIMISVLTLWSLSFSLIKTNYLFSWMLSIIGLVFLVINWLFDKALTYSLKKALNTNLTIKNNFKGYLKKTRMFIYSFAITMSLIIFSVINSHNFDSTWKQNSQDNLLESYKNESINLKHLVDESFNNIELIFDVGNIQIGFSNDNYIRIVSNNENDTLVYEKVEKEINQNLLIISSNYQKNRFWWFNDYTDIVYKVWLPKDYNKSIYIATDLGKIEFDTNTYHLFETLTLKNEVGNINIKNISAKNYHLYSTFGNINFNHKKSLFNSSISINTKVGNINIDYPETNVIYNNRTKIGETTNFNNHINEKNISFINCETTIGNIIIKNNDIN